MNEMLSNVTIIQDNNNNKNDNQNTNNNINNNNNNSSNEEIINTTNCNINFEEIPLNALGTRCRQMLSILLNPTKVLLSEEGLPRDWRGVMHFTGLSNQYGPVLSNKSDPLGELLKIWCNQQSVGDDDQPISLAQFQRILGIIDRWDVIDDTNNYFLDDAEKYLNIKLKNDIANKSSSNLNSNNNNNNNTSDPSSYFNPDANILTIDDVTLAQQGLPPQQYDAFVLFADDDIDFATEIIEKMEDYGLKLCVKERDLIGGISFEHEAILRLISDRCTRLIVVLSPAFLKSSANTFFVNFAQALGIEQRKRKIIPCQYESCSLPPTLSYFFLLNYQRSGRLYNFWEKLKDSIQSSPVELAAANANNYSRLTITELESSSQLTQQQKPQRLSIMPASPGTVNNMKLTSNTNVIKNDVTIKNVENSTPIAAPRKRKDKKYLSNQQSNSKTMTTIPQIVISLHQEHRQENTTDKTITTSNENITLEKRIWPPQPKLRTTTSMWNLSSINSPIDGSNGISKSTLSLNTSQLSSSSSSIKDAKKPKWYKKLLSPNSVKLSDTSDTDSINSKTKDKKRKWFRKKITSLS